MAQLGGFVFQIFVQQSRSEEIVASNKLKAVTYLTFIDKISLSDLKDFLLNFEDKNTSDFRKLLSFYDYIFYKINSSQPPFEKGGAVT
ncbi:hypothetical protein [Acinetobacter brisouii]|uniref:hypothetical protein n=1 Tax=Acinetobacter brisouii TaxID=396323 RepID=UPI001C070C09|nr:hypothetical protein [Acinetobacter brisouii]